MAGWKIDKISIFHREYIFNPGLFSSPCFFYQRVTQHFSKITLGTYINFGYPQLQGLPRGPPFQGRNCLEFSPCLKSPLKKSMGPNFWREIFSRKWVMLILVDVFRKPNCVFFKGIFEAINCCTCHAQVGGSSSRHGNYDDLRMLFIRIAQMCTHLSLQRSSIWFLEPKGCHFLFLARKLHGWVVEFVASNFFWRVTGAVCLCSMFFFAC